MVPIGDVATANLESLVVVLDGYKKEENKKPGESFEVYGALPQQLAAAALGGIFGNVTDGNGEGKTASSDDDDDTQHLDWTAHIEGGGSIVFGGGGDGLGGEENDFMNENVGYVNVTLDAHTDEPLLDHGEFRVVVTARDVRVAREGLVYCAEAAA